MTTFKFKKLSKIIRVGNSAAVIIPVNFMKRNDLKVGDQLDRFDERSEYKLLVQQKIKKQKKGKK